MEDNNQIEYRKYLDDISHELTYLYRKKNKIKLILRLYSFIGILTAVIAIIYFVISYYKFNITNTQRIALMSAGVGLLLSLMSKFYTNLIEEREKEQKARTIELNKISRFILSWATLERTIYSILERHEPDISKFGIKRNIRLLFEEEIISDREFINLERALDLRNKIVHGQTLSATEELDKYSGQVDEIIDKILISSKKTTN
ncbi:hypothetical protein LT679_14675 [Mucilaginibacter roseus]|uniref:RiboL-PSP-HEPN domain-containing protein n=1 Tax=Mucilaginibacter roseus TaxID=1528868 RepID=A0ABS8U6Y6_9SPHI|nr:hypothetical protein [Mucilaginibacter roseus]MCD8741858.1 hypothetical protein [Mucilaginibacter roseus]